MTLEPRRNSTSFPCLSLVQQLLRASGRVVLAGLALCLLDQRCSLLAQQEQPELRRPKASIGRAVDPPEIDGILTDPAWAETEAITDFFQRIPFNGAPASQRTVVRLLLDDRYIYVAAYMYQDPQTIKAASMRNGTSFVRTDDTFEIALDTFLDQRRAYDFVVNPNGARHDTQIDGPHAFNDSWDEVWEVRTSFQPDGWCAELRIPLRILRFDPGRDTWGVGMQRRIQANQEWDNWVPTPVPYDISHLGFAGDVSGFAALRAQRNLQAIPAVVASQLQSQGSSADYDAEPSLDVKYVPGGNVTLDFTANTDFAQVEADNTQVNLTRFSLFFPEKRPFFLESAGLFDFGLSRDTQIFFSRRIGIAEGGSVPIWGGARLTGKTGPYSVGLMTMQTKDSPLQEATNYSAVRVRRDVGPRSRVGAIFTNVSASGYGNQAFGTDLNLWASANLQVGGFWAATTGTTVGGTAQAHHVYADYQTDPWGLTLAEKTVGSGFDPGIGYVRRDDIHDFTGTVRKRYRFNKPWSRNVDLTGSMTYLTDSEFRPLTRSLSLEVANTQPSGDSVSFSYQRQFEQLTEDFPISPPVIIPIAAYWFDRGTLDWSSSPARRVSGSASASWGGFYGGRQQTVYLSGLFWMSNHLNVAPEYEQNWVQLPAGTFDTQVGRLRINYNLNPNLGISALLQWNSTTQEFSTNIVFKLLYLNDSSVYLVFNERQNHGTDGWMLGQRTGIFKITYRIYL